MKRAGFRIIRFVCSPLVRFLWPTKIVGKENLITDSRAIYIANHISAMDTNVMAVKIFKKDFNVLVKEEAYEKFESFFKIMGAIPVKRDEADVKAVKSILRLLNEDRQLLIFPEGTRNKDSDALLPFKNGCALFALKTKSPIIPLLITEKYRVFHRNVIVIGKPIFLEEYFDKPANGVKDEVTQILYETMTKMKQEHTDAECK